MKILTSLAPVFLTLAVVGCSNANKSELKQFDDTVNVVICDLDSYSSVAVVSQGSTVKANYTVSSYTRELSTRKEGDFFRFSGTEMGVPFHFDYYSRTKTLLTMDHQFIQCR